MAEPEQETKDGTEPRGFSERSRGLAGEYAHEQGWGLHVEERARQEKAPQDMDGGTDYEYGAQDFGDEPVNTAIDPERRARTQNIPSSTANPKGV